MPLAAFPVGRGHNKKFSFAKGLSTIQGRSVQGASRSFSFCSRQGFLPSNRGQTCVPRHGHTRARGSLFEAVFSCSQVLREAGSEVTFPSLLAGPLVLVEV